MKVTIDPKKKKIVIELDMDERPSASGKSTLLATTGASPKSDAEYKGKPVYVNASVYVKVNS